MTFKGLVLRFVKIKHRICVKLYPEALLKQLLQTTPFQDVRREIWIKLGNEIGQGAYLNSVKLIDSDEIAPNVIIGARAAIAPGVVMITCSSPNDSDLNNVEAVKHCIKTAQIQIGEDTWIGANTVIHPGVKIGKRCIIGACSNVTKDIPDGSVAYGNPARVIRKTE